MPMIASQLFYKPLFSPNHHAICGTHPSSISILLGASFSQDWSAGVWSWPLTVTNV